MSVNKAILIGRCGKDPETRYMTNGEAVTNVSIATSETWKDKSGEKQERVEWHNLVFYKRLAEIVGEYVKKGSEVYVEGKIQTRKWQDKEGKDRYTTEIVCHEMKMLGGKSESQTKEQQSQPAKQQTRTVDSGDGFSDDVPFANPFRKTCAMWRCM